VIIVTGANKGIGKAIVAQLLAECSTPSLIYLTSRNVSLGQAAVKELASVPSKSELAYHALDISSQQSINAFRDFVKKEHGQIACLVNNAGWASKGPAFDSDIVRNSLDINYYGTRNACQAFLPLIKEGGRLVNVSSMASKLHTLKSRELEQEFRSDSLTVSGIDDLMKRFQTDVDNGDWTAKGWPTAGYSVSKMGVTALTKALARDYKGKVLINACCPGWVKTDMAGPNAPRTTEQGAQTPVHLAINDIGNITGEFWEDCKVSSW